MHFVNTVRNSTFSPDVIDQETFNTSVKIQRRTQEMVGQQYDPSYLKDNSLPPVPKAFNGPILQKKVENPRNNIFVVTNDAHIKSTNPGYSTRNNGGQPFCR